LLQAGDVEHRRRRAARRDGRRKWRENALDQKLLEQGTLALLQAGDARRRRGVRVELPAAEKVRVAPEPAHDTQAEAAREADRGNEAAGARGLRRR
jgi:hypothetical protein